jgi:hypothetical protein
VSTISNKQDRAYARTAQDIERKYAFGKTFADMLGLINDNRDKVDKVESSLRDEIREQSTTLYRDTQQIVMEAKNELTSSISDVSDDVTELSSKVKMKLDADAVSIIVEKEIANGVERVETKSGYVFDSDGLNISKSGEAIQNKLTHEGMYVTKSGSDVLVADKDGVAATDLHAKTYLIIGKDEGRSRFEDYTYNGTKRTGCFWIGG